MTSKIQEPGVQGPKFTKIDLEIAFVSLLLLFFVTRALGYFKTAILSSSKSVHGISGVKTEEIRKGRILGGVQGSLEGIFGDPSLTQIQ